MGRVEDLGLKQKAVLWTRAGYDKHGEIKVNAAVEIDVRWERALSQRMSEDDTPIAITATIDVDRDIAVGSLLWLGNKIDLPAVIANITNLVQVIGFDSIPDIKGRVFQRSVTVKKWRDRLPPIV